MLPLTSFTDWLMQMFIAPFKTGQILQHIQQPFFTLMIWLLLMQCRVLARFPPATTGGQARKLAPCIRFSKSNCEKELCFVFFSLKNSTVSFTFAVIYTDLQQQNVVLIYLVGKFLNFCEMYFSKFAVTTKIQLKNCTLLLISELQTLHNLPWRKTEQTTKTTELYQAKASW